MPKYLVCRTVAWYHHVVSNIWTPEKIENYKCASEYSSFHRKLSVLAEPYLDENWTLADIGCGPALIDFWLAPMVKDIEAIDSDPDVIKYLDKYLDELFATNRRIAEKINPVHASLKDLSGMSWDVVTMSFFGVNEDILDTVLPLAKKRALIYMHGRQDAAGLIAALDDGGKFTASEMEHYLEEKGFSYKKNIMEMQFGQPFKSIEDIHKFFSSYEGSEDYERRVADAEDRIVKTNRFDYPYYLPKSISVALFIISAGQSAAQE